MKTKTLELSTRDMSKIELSSEEDTSLGLATVKGKISEADVVNENNFIITSSEWEDMLQNPINSKKLALGKMYGCVGHDARPVDNKDIRKGEVSHIINELWMEGKDVMCKATILETASGKNLLACLKGGGFMQASTRLAVSQVHMSNGSRGLIGSESEILTVDFVIDPAIVSTYISLASKEENEEVLTVQKDTDILLSSKLLETDLSFHKELLEKEKKINAILKGIRK